VFSIFFLSLLVFQSYFWGLLFITYLILYMLLYSGTTFSSNNLRHSHYWRPIVRSLEYILWHTHKPNTGYNLQQTSTEVMCNTIELSNQFLSLRKLVSITMGDQSILCKAKMTLYLKNYMDSTNTYNTKPLNVRAGSSNNLPMFFNPLKPSGCFMYHKV
jgi:hypothetical protein